MSEFWLVPFSERNNSEEFTQNFLWKSKNIYIMDNHRAALWCWIQHMEIEEVVSICHIDKHTDTLRSQLPYWMKLLPSDLSSISINDYLRLTYTNPNTPNYATPLFSWDNYLSIFLEKYSEQINFCAFATHGIGDKPNFRDVTTLNNEYLPEELEKLFSKSDQPWLINLDLDFFFHKPDGEHYENKYSDSFAREIFFRIKQLNDTGNAKAITVALSPECCGGWRNSERMASQFCEVLDLSWQLP